MKHQMTACQPLKALHTATAERAFAAIQLFSTFKVKTHIEHSFGSLLFHCSMGGEKNTSKLSTAIPSADQTVMLSMAKTETHSR